MSGSNLDAALGYAERGRAVHPLKSNKKPLTEHGFLDASTDPEVIRKWWSKWPDAWIATPTGDGFFVVDIDPRHGGDKSLSELETEHGFLPETRKVTTPGGGLHFYFAADDVTNRRGQMPAGIDIRGKGGYVCLPPSPGYRWESEADMVPAPEWLLELLRPSSNGNGPAPVIEGMISEGARHATLLSLAGTMRRRGMLPNEIEAALLEVNKRCHPPQDIADIRRLARDSGRWKVEAAAAPSFDELNELLGLAAIDKRVDVVKMFGRGGRAHVRLELDDGGWIQLDPVGACATPMKLAHEIALQTGAAPEFKTEQVKRVLVLFRLLGEHHEAVTVADMAFELADVYLRDAVVVDVDMNDQASRWRSFSDLVNRRDAILLDSKTGLRYVRIDPFRSYLANHCAPGEPHIVMSELQRAGWKKTGNRGLIKASQPGGRGELVRTFLIVPDDWEEVR